VPSSRSVVTSSLQQFGEIRRGWLGVKIQQVTDEIAESSHQAGARALIAGIDDKGPLSLPHRGGDVIIKFDGKDIKEMPICRASSPTRRSAAMSR